MSDQESDSPRDAFAEIWEHRPRMTYENLSLVFDKAGDLIIEDREEGAAARHITVQEWQLDLVLAFIKQHRLSPMHAGIAAAFSRRGHTGVSAEPPE
jgi:hypothetical protein